MSLPNSLQMVLFHCVTDSHMRILKTKRKDVPTVNELTKNIWDDNIDLDEEARKIAINMKANDHMFLRKWYKWVEAYDNKRWCTRCGRKPPMKGNRFFCSHCFRLNGNKVNIAGGGGRITRGAKEK